MSRFKITTTPSGKCDVTITLFNSDNSIVTQRTITFDIKPTVKELINRFKDYKKEGATHIRLTTTPSCSTKTYKL